MLSLVRCGFRVIPGPASEPASGAAVGLCWRGLPLVFVADKLDSTSRGKLWVTSVMYS